MAEKTENLYEVLGVQRDATSDTIKRAYRSLAQKLHPDKPGGSEEAFATLQHAYDVLSDPARRKEYDETGTATSKKSLEDRALDVLAQGFNNWLTSFLQGQCGGDPVASMRTSGAQELVAIQERNRKFRNDAKKLRKMAKRMRVKNDRPNLFTFRAEQLADGADRALSAGLENEEVFKRMLEILTDFSFEDDAMEEMQKRLGSFSLNISTSPNTSNW